MISWEPWQGLEGIVRGQWDDYVRNYAGAVAAYGKPLFLRFGHEMNLPQIPWFGQSETFRAAWQRVHATFRDVGATNVRWVWCPYVGGAGTAELRPYFPGVDLVDWPALDGYNWGRRGWWQRWTGFERLFGPSLSVLRELAPNRPVMLAEIGCAPGRRKGDWMRDALLRAIPDAHAEVSAVVWFNEHRPEHADWRIDSSPDALAAWRDVAADPRYSLSADDLLSVVSA